MPSPPPSGNTLGTRQRNVLVSGGTCRSERKEPLSSDDATQRLEATPGIEPGYRALQAHGWHEFVQVGAYSWCRSRCSGHALGTLPEGARSPYPCATRFMRDTVSLVPE